MTHASNVTGEIVDLTAIVQLVRIRAPHAKIVVDGVAYAPHRALHCDGWDVDFYVASMYKLYGPHIAAMYARASALLEIEGPNHYFIPDDDIPNKFEASRLHNTNFQEE